MAPFRDSIGVGRALRAYTRPACRSSGRANKRAAERGRAAQSVHREVIGMRRTIEDQCAGGAWRLTSIVFKRKKTNEKY
jgi:hypothetical protein